jgi:thioredoxin-related protein
MKRQALIVITFLACAFIQSTALAAAGKDPYKYFFNETWGDFAEELATAREQGKKGILIFFEMDECPFCHYMKMNVLNQPEVQAFYQKNFLIFTVDIEGDIEITNMQGKTMKQKDFAFRENRVRATPVFAFFDLEGNRIFRHTGKTSGVEEFIWMGQYVADGIYKETSFTRYKRNKRKEKKK